MVIFSYVRVKVRVDLNLLNNYVDHCVDAQLNPLGLLVLASPERSCFTLGQNGKRNSDLVHFYDGEHGSTSTRFASIKNKSETLKQITRFIFLY